MFHDGKPVDLTHVSRLEFDARLAYKKFGVKVGRRIYDGGSGLELPSDPPGDSMMARSRAGLEPNYHWYFAWLHHTVPERALAGETAQLCAYGHEPPVPTTPTAGPSVSLRANRLGYAPRETVIDLRVGVDYGTISRLRVTHGDTPLENGFAPDESDLMRLEVSDDTLWAYPVHAAGFDAADRVRIAPFRTSVPGESPSQAYDLRFTFDAAKAQCQLSVAPATSAETSRDRTVIWLDDTYCDPLESRDIGVSFVSRLEENDGEVHPLLGICVSESSIHSKRVLSW